MVVLAQVPGQFGETLSALQRFVPRLLAFVAILVIGYLAARALARLTDTALKRLGFERAVQRGGVKDALARSGYDPSDLLARIVFYGLMLLVLQLAFAVFGPNPVSTLLNGAIAFLPRLFIAALIVVISAAIAAVVRDVIVSLIGSLSYGRLLALCAYGLVLGVGVFAALSQLQVAPAIVNGLFYALLAIIVGVTVVAVGGGGIAPMRQRWERALSRMDDEAVRIRQAAQEERERREAAERAEREHQEELERQEELAHQEELERQERERQEELAHQEELERQERERQEELARQEELERQEELARQEELERQQWLEQQAFEEEQRLAGEHEATTQRVTPPTGYAEPEGVDTEPRIYEEPQDELYEPTHERQYPRPDDRRRLRAARRSSLDRDRPPIRYRDLETERTARTADELRDEQMLTDADETVDAAAFDETQTISRDDLEAAGLDDADAAAFDETQTIGREDADDVDESAFEETQLIDPDDTQVSEPRRWERPDD